MEKSTAGTKKNLDSLTVGRAYRSHGVATPQNSG